MCILKPAGIWIYTAIWGRSRKFIAVPTEGNCTEGNEYHHINILSFMKKKIQELVTSNIGDESLWYIYYIYNKLPTNQGSPQKPQCTMRLHIHRENQEIIS
jgi:hypothetical protein